MTYDEPIGIESLVSNIGDILQQYTQNAGVRPFGVSMIVAGVDAGGSRLLTTDPSGSYRGYKAAALGANSEKARELLEKKYKDDISLDDAITLAIDAIKAAYSNGLKPENVNAAVISVETKSFKKLTEEEVKKHF
jgi:proteasome alpha subunit